MFNNYIGKAGQLFAMSEFLMLGYNVAVPEVDRGDDIFVVKDTNGDLNRVQVKTAQAKGAKNNYIAQFALPREQLRLGSTPDIQYVLLIRHQNEWKNLIAISRQDLSEKLAKRLEKPSASKNINLSLTVSGTRTKAGKIDFTDYQRLSDLFPEINH